MPVGSSPIMGSLVRRAPLLGGVALALTALCFGWATGTGEHAPADASVVFAFLAFIMGLLAPGRRATLLLVVPSLVFLSFVIEVAAR